MDERRRYIRAGAPFLIDVQDLDNHRAFEAYGWSIGRGGLGFYSEVPLAMESNVRLTVNFLGSRQEKPPETVDATVRWVQAISRGFAVGAEFHELDEVRHFVLLAYLDHAETTLTELARNRMPDQ